MERVETKPEAVNLHAYPVPKPGAAVHNTVLWGVDTLQVAVRVSPVLTLVYVALTGVLEGPKFEPTRATCVPPAVFSVTRGLSWDKMGAA